MRPTAAIAGYEKTLADARNNAQSIAGQMRDKLMAEADERRKTLEGKLPIACTEAEKTIAQTKTAGDVECPRHRNRHGLRDRRAVDRQQARPEGRDRRGRPDAQGLRESR